MCRRVSVVVAVVALTLLGCTLGTRPPQPTPDRPQVRFTAPPPGSQVARGTDVTLSVLAEDRTGSGIAELVVVADGALLETIVPQAGVVPVFTANVVWRATEPGRHSLGVVARRADGTASTTATLVLDVLPG